MNFWDSSAIIPFCLDEEMSPVIAEIARKDSGLVVWWGTQVEVYSAFARQKRDGSISTASETASLSILSELADFWTEIEPSDEIRDIARRILQIHPLRAADSLQLAAAILWSGKRPKGHHFVCLDARLREAARKEGFVLLPSAM